MRPVRAVPTSSPSSQRAPSGELTKFVILGRLVIVGCALVAFVLTLWLTTHSFAIVETILIPTLIAVAAIVVVSMILLAGVMKWMEHIGLGSESGAPVNPMRYLLIRCLLGVAAGYLFAVWYLRSQTH